jgi:hypothetical protein
MLEGETRTMTFPIPPNPNPEPRPEPHADPHTTPESVVALRILFLDDDPARAESFLAEHTEAVWVQTAAECIGKLAEAWDEVHLDHDLCGEHFVHSDREDCGMAVVRWLTAEARPHLGAARYVVHSHNPAGATMMGVQLIINGYTVELRPFGTQVEPAEPETTAMQDDGAPSARPSLLSALARLVRKLFGRAPLEEEAETFELYGYSAHPRDESEKLPPPLPERLDFSWTKPASLEQPSGSGRHTTSHFDHPPPERLDFSWMRPAPPELQPEPRRSADIGPED